MHSNVDAFVAGVGTGGTFSGVARFLKEHDAGILTVAVETQGSVLQGGEAGPHRVEGIGVSFIPGSYDPSTADQIIQVSDDQAFRIVQRLAAEEAYWQAQAAAQLSMPPSRSPNAWAQASA